MLNQSVSRFFVSCGLGTTGSSPKMPTRRENLSPSPHGQQVANSSGHVALSSAAMTTSGLNCSIVALAFLAASSFLGGAFFFASLNLLVQFPALVHSWIKEEPRQSATAPTTAPFPLHHKSKHRSMAESSKANDDAGTLVVATRFHLGKAAVPPSQAPEPSHDSPVVQASLSSQLDRKSVV